jgi:hypothetical protein
MIKKINLNGKIQNFKFDEKSSFLKPFIMTKRNSKTEKFFEDIKNAINLRDSKFLDCLIDDYGLKIIDEQEKGFCIKWEDIEKIKELNDFNITDTDTEDVINEKEIQLEIFIDKCLDLVIEAINNDK